MHLSEFYPKFSLLNPDNVKRLKGFQISSVQDLLGSDPEKLVNILDASYTEVSKLQDDLFVSLAGFPESSLDLYQKIIQDEITLRSGSPELDSFIRGGFKTGNIYEVFGQAGTGKTQLCFSLAVEGILHDNGIEVGFIDTKNDLAPERILQILQARTSDKSNLNLLNRIKVYKCFNAVDLLDTLRLLTQKLKKKENQVRLILVDNLVSTILPLLAEDIKMASFYGNKLTQSIQKLSSLGCCVVTANNARFSDGQLSPALGKIWAKLADIRLKLEHTEGSAAKRITVVKGGGTKSEIKNECQISIGRSGFQ